MLLESKENPFIVHDIVGTGFPVALQNKIILSPSVLWIICGRGLISGLSTVVKMRHGESLTDHYKEEKVTSSVASKRGRSVP